MLEEKVEKLSECVKIASSKGHYDYDPYFQGMANGLILAEAIMKGKPPVYMTAPEKWGSDITNEKAAAALAARQVLGI